MRNTYMRNVAQLLTMQDLAHTLILRLGRMLCRRVGFADRSWNDGDVELARKLLVAGQELFGLGTGEDKVRVFGRPGGEVVLWEDGEVAASRGCFADGGFCLGKVRSWVDGLLGKRQY